ncbi:MAG: ABC transporter [Nitrospirae bacterium GWC1_57_7]|nr:MAG: ABC transporter [Nitrospirae bacterium GWC1_57_7]
MALLVLDNIAKVYEAVGETIRAVGGVSLAVEKGEFISIVGHSGSGKTTLLSIIGGLCRPTSGSILYNDSDIGALDSDGLAKYRAERIGFMFQFASLLPVLTAKENLMLPLLFQGARDRSAKGDGEQKAEELLRRVGLADKINAYPAQLSGGQQRRVAIARAFMNDPEIILADEPTGDLDEQTEEDKMRFFQAMNREQGVTFIMVTHNRDLASRASRQFSMTHGAHEELARA